MRADKKDKKIALLLFVLFSVLYLSTIKTGSDSPNVASRLALVQAIVEQGKLSIDDSLFSREASVDRAYLKGHYYSDKAPGLSLTAVPFYWILHHLGISFARERARAEQLLLIPFTVLAALVPMLFFLISRFYTDDLKSRVSVSLAVGAGTGVFVYSGVFLSHSSTAALLTLSFYCTLRARENPNWLWLSGATSGMATLFEYPAVFLAMAIHLNHVLQRRGTSVGIAILSSLPFVALVLLYNVHITGGYLDFPYYHVNDLPGRPWEANTNKPDLARISVQHVAHALFFGYVSRLGNTYYQGFFLYSPFLLLGLAYSRKEYVVPLLGSAAVCLLYLTQIDPVGGCVFSNRFLVVTVPFLALPCLALAKYWPKVFFIAAGASVIMNFIGNTVAAECNSFPLGPAIRRVPLYPHHTSSVVSTLLVLLILFVLYFSTFGKNALRESPVSEWRSLP